MSNLSVNLGYICILQLLLMIHIMSPDLIAGAYQSIIRKWAFKKTIWLNKKKAHIKPEHGDFWVIDMRKMK